MTVPVHPIDAWLATLATLLNPSQPLEAQQPLRALRGHIATFDMAAFTPATAREIAGAKRFGPIPSWDVIEPILRRAVRDARPINFGLLPAPRIPDPEPPTEDQMDRIGAMAAECRQIAREAAHTMRLADPRPLPDVSLTREQVAITHRQRLGV